MKVLSIVAVALMASSVVMAETKVKVEATKAPVSKEVKTETPVVASATETKKEEKKSSKKAKSKKAAKAAKVEATNSSKN
jgi:predicted Holliday junction resolvase-like endonuclease